MGVKCVQCHIDKPDDEFFEDSFLDNLCHECRAENKRVAKLPMRDVYIVSPNGAKGKMMDKWHEGLTEATFRFSNGRSATLQMNRVRPETWRRMEMEELMDDPIEQVQERLMEIQTFERDEPEAHRQLDSLYVTALVEIAGGCDDPAILAQEALHGERLVTRYYEHGRLTCKYGHPWVPENLYVHPGTNALECRDCRREQRRRSNQKAKSMQPA